MSTNVTMGMIRPIEKVYEQESKSQMRQDLLENDGAYLKKILVLDKDGFCSPDIISAENALKGPKIKFSGIKCSRDTQNIVKLLRSRWNDQHTLLKALNNENFTTVSKIFENNPYVLYTYKNDHMFDQLNKAFISKFIQYLPYPIPYEQCIKPFLHQGFNFDVRNGSGMPLLCEAIVSGSGDEYLDLLKAGVWVNVQDQQGNTPISYAAALGDTKKIDMLLLYGAAVNKNIGTKIPAQHPMRPLMVQLFRLQQCCACATHEDYLSNIPCVNRHLRPEVSFICKGCYNQMDEKKCPLCARLLGKFGT